MFFKAIPHWGNPPLLFKQTVLGSLLALSLVGAMLPYAVASDVFPESVKTWLKQEDALVDVREDGWVQFTNGDEYLLIIPAELPKEPPAVVSAETDVPAANRPDVISLNNGYYLLRITTLTDGQKTLPIVDTIPSNLKSGHFAEQFVRPSQLYIPTQWKSLLIDVPEATETTMESTTLPVWIASGASLYQPTLPASSSNTATVPTWTVKELPCQPGLNNALQILPNSQALLTCGNNLYHLQLDNDGVTTLNTIVLDAAAGGTAYDTEKQLLYIAHPLLQYEGAIKKPITGGWVKLREAASDREQSKPVQMHSSKISVYSVQQQKLLAPLVIAEPAQAILYSGFRQTLYTLSSKGNIIEMINTNDTGYKQKLTLAVTVKDWGIQHDKILWLLTADENPPRLLGLDLRWQELYQVAKLPTNLDQIVVLDDWLYGVDNKNQQVVRFSGVNNTNNNQSVVSENYSASTKVFNGNNCQDVRLMRDLTTKQIWASSKQCQQLAEVDLDQFRVKPTTSLSSVIGDTPIYLYSSLPTPTVDESIAKVRLQDGRMLLQNNAQPLAKD